LVKPLDGKAKRLSDGKEVFVFIQIITAFKSKRKTVCVIEDQEKSFYNVSSEVDLKKVVSSFLGKFQKFIPEVLYIDNLYDTELVYMIIDAFVTKRDVESLVNEYNLNKNKNK